MSTPTDPLLPNRTSNPPSYISEQTTSYIDKSFCCCHIAYFPLGHFTIIGHWKVQLCSPFLSSLAFAILHALFVYDTSHTSPTPLFFQIANTITGFCLLCFFLSFFSIIIIGPGYVPHDWAKTRFRSYSWSYSMSHLLQLSDQIDAVRSTTERPPRSSFSITALRFVLRADHYCGWAQSWIGLHNHRFFMLTCFWASVYLLANLGGRAFFYTKVIQNFEYQDIPGLVGVLLGLCLLAFTGYHFGFAACNLRRNVTAIEKWNGRIANRYDKGCLQNYEEVCGRRGWLMCWPFPWVWCLKPEIDGFYGTANLQDSLPTLSEIEITSIS